MVSDVGYAGRVKMGECQIAAAGGMMVKAITIKQPWAWLIVNGINDIENRPWLTRYRGPILIHAGQSPYGGSNRAAVEAARQVCRERGLPVLEALVPEVLDYGGIVGMAEVVDCVTAHPSPAFYGPYGFVLRGARVLPYVPCKGALMLWHVDEHVLMAYRVLTADRLLTDC